MDEGRQSPAIATRARRWLRGLWPDAGDRARGRVAHGIYHELVNQARMPAFYRDLGVPDTPEGRFEMVGLHVALAWRRLKVEGPGGNALGQDIFDLMFADIDESLRQIGIGDLAVGRQVRRLAGQFYARLKALDEALGAAPPAALEAMLRTNVYHGGTPPSERQLDALVGYLMAAERALWAHSGASLFAGRLPLVPPPAPRHAAAGPAPGDPENGL